MSEVVVSDVALPGGSISYHRLGHGHGSPVLAGPIGAFYSSAGVLAHPLAGTFVRSLAAFVDCILMDRRGLGYSDPIPAGWEPTIERQAHDLLGMLDHAGVERAWLLAIGFDAQAVFWFAAEHPERTAGVIALGTTAKLVQSADHPTGVDGQFIEQWIASMDPSAEVAGPEFADLLAPSLGRDDAFRRWLHDVGRHSASPDTARRYVNVAAGADVRDHVRKISAPMLIMHHARDEFVDVADARLLAELAPRAHLRVYDLDGHAIYVGDTEQKLIDLESFVTGRTGRSRRKHNVTGWESFTPAQRQVARLVAGGRTNAEIATELRVSPETVKSHVSAALRKSGLRSRTELAAYIASRIGTMINRPGE